MLRRSPPPPTPKLPFQQITSPPPNPLTLKLQIYMILMEQFDSVELLTTLAHVFVHRLATPAKDSKLSSQFLKSNITVTKRVERKYAKQKYLEGHVMVSGMRFVERTGEEEQSTEPHKDRK